MRQKIEGFSQKKKKSKHLVGFIYDCPHNPPCHFTFCNLYCVVTITCILMPSKKKKRHSHPDTPYYTIRLPPKLALGMGSERPALKAAPRGLRLAQRPATTRPGFFKSQGHPHPPPGAWAGFDDRAIRLVLVGVGRPPPAFGGVQTSPFFSP